MSNKLPDCANWNVWLGEEIEGTKELGSLTLFIRKLSPLKGLNEYADLIRKRKVKRIWLCAEFKDWGYARVLIDLVPSAAIEVNHQTLGSLPRDLKDRCRLYYKLPVELKDGDFVCVGPAFNDEAFEISQGARVTPAQYSKDERID